MKTRDESENAESLLEHENVQKLLVVEHDRLNKELLCEYISTQIVDVKSLSTKTHFLSKCDNSELHLEHDN